MLRYTTIGVNDLDRAQAFYEPLVTLLGGKGLFRSQRMRFYTSADGAMLALCLPYDKEPATPGNGAMYAFQADSREMVDAAHAAALEGGATCEGKPGNRTKTLYMAYFRDPEGNKLGVFHMESPEMFARDAQELSGAMLG